jgi:hypothetical protein
MQLQVPAALTITVFPGVHVQCTYDYCFHQIYTIQSVNADAWVCVQRVASQ